MKTVASALCLFVLFMACSPLPVPHPERWTPEYGSADYPITEVVSVPKAEYDAGYSQVDADLGTRQ